MLKNNTKAIIPFSVAVYIVGIAMMIFGTKNDLSINMALFNPQSRFAIYFEAFSQIVYWGIWGPIFTVLFLTRHGLNESLEIAGRIFPFIHPISNTKTKAYKTADKALKCFMVVLFFALAVIGWKKLIENTLKHLIDLSQPVYFIICAAVAIVAILLFSRIDKKTLNKLEGLALAGLLLGIFYKLVEHSKEITNRVRFREMIAYSNSILDEKGLSCAKTVKLKSPLTSDMAERTDFSAFTKWYKSGYDMGIYSNANSFPSGHTVYSTSIALSCLFCSAFDKLKRFAPYFFFLSFIYVCIVGYSRLITGAHYLTDVTAGALIGYTLFLIVCGIYDRFINKGILPTR